MSETHFDVFSSGQPSGLSSQRAFPEGKHADPMDAEQPDSLLDGWEPQPHQDRRPVSGLRSSPRRDTAWYERPNRNERHSAAKRRFPECRRGSASLDGPYLQAHLAGRTGSALRGAMVRGRRSLSGRRAAESVRCSGELLLLPRHSDGSGPQCVSRV